MLMNHTNQYQYPSSSSTIVSTPTVRGFDNSIENDTSKDEDDEELESDSEDNNLYLSVELSSQSVQRLKNLTLEQSNFLKQLGVLSIQFENEKYGLCLKSPKRRRSGLKSGKKDEPSIVTPPGASFAYIPSSGLVLNESNVGKYTNMDVGTCGKQQFTMPCPMLKTLLKDESSAPIDTSSIQSDELMKIFKLRQTLASQTQETAASSGGATTVPTGKKPRSRAPSDKPKPKRASKAKTEQGGESKSGLTEPSQPSAKKDHLPQEKIRNILNDAQHYQQMAMTNQFGHQQSIQIQHVQQQINQQQYQMNIYNTDQQVAFVAQPINIVNNNQNSNLNAGNVIDSSMRISNNMI